MQLLSIKVNVEDQQDGIVSKKKKAILFNSDNLSSTPQTHSRRKELRMYSWELSSDIHIHSHGMHMQI